MDCVIPGHSVRLFATSLSFLSKVGTDIYWDFDPIQGLTLRALNDAKSAFACVRYQPAFFERCTAPPAAVAARSRGQKRKSSDGDNDDNATPSSQEPSFSCRVVARTLVAPIRQRKHVVSLRIRSSGSQEEEQGEDNNNTSTSLCLSFEFLLQKQPTSDISVVHVVQAMEATSVSAVVPTDDHASEIVAAPKVLWRLLEPLFARTNEASLMVPNDAAQMVQAASFHHEELLNNPTTAAGADTKNSSLQQTQAAAKNLKTETGMHVDEFEDFVFYDQREVGSNAAGPPPSVNDHVVLVFPVKEVKALLQFCNSNCNDRYHSNANNDAMLLQHALSRLSLFFTWGGRPLVWKTCGGGNDNLWGEEEASSSFSAQLVLATLDHKLLNHHHHTQSQTTTTGAAAAAAAAPSSALATNRNTAEDAENSQ